MTELIPYCDLVFTEGLEREDGERPIMRSADDISYPRYDDAYYEVFRKYNKRMRPCLTGDKKDDPLYDDAVDYVIEKQEASVSMLQREFRIGYVRATELIGKMEKEGVVSVADKENSRTVLEERCEFTDYYKPRRRWL